MKINYNRSYWNHKYLSPLLLSRVTRIATKWGAEHFTGKDFDLCLLFATSDETPENVTHLFLQQLWSEPPELTFLVNALKNTSFSYNPTPLLPNFDLKAITKINNSFYLDKTLISGVMLLCPVNFSPNNPKCPNCDASWDVYIGCVRCGLSPQDLT